MDWPTRLNRYNLNYRKYILSARCKPLECFAHHQSRHYLHQQNMSPTSPHRLNHHSFDLYHHKPLQRRGRYRYFHHRNPMNWLLHNPPLFHHQIHHHQYPNTWHSCHHNHPHSIHNQRANNKINCPQKHLQNRLRPRLSNKFQDSHLHQYHHNSRQFHYHRFLMQMDRHLHSYHHNHHLK